MSMFDASNSVLGFSFQERQALLLAIKRADQTPAHDLSIEKLDDVAIESSAGATAWQIKHTTTAITDSASDLWKTLRVWSQGISDGTFNESETTFILLSSSSASPNSAPALLRNDSDRNVESAHQKLLDASSQSTNAGLASAFSAFSALSRSAQLAMLSNTFVADSSPNITQVRIEIENEVRWACPPNRRSAFVDRLEGWWHNTLIQLLSGATPKSILLGEFASQIQTLRREFDEENLPIDYLDVRPTADEEKTFKEKLFARQLELVGLDRGVIHAIVDYYRAGLQRSRWISDALIYTSALDRYDVKLQEEWQAQYDFMLDCMSEGEAEEELMRLGRDLHGWMRERSALRIVEGCSEPYVRRGSYYKLSEQLKVGWHPKFLERLSAITSGANL